MSKPEANPASSRIAILDVLTTLNWALRNGDGDLFAAQFTEEGILSHPRGQVAGPEQLREFANSTPFSGRGREVQPWTGPTKIEIAGEAASCLGFAGALVREDTGAVFFPWLGCQEDDLVRTGGTWKVTRRAVGAWDARELARWPAVGPA